LSLLCLPPPTLTYATGVCVSFNFSFKSGTRPFQCPNTYFLRLAYIFLNFRCKLVFGKQILSVSTNPTKQSIEQDNLGSSANSLTSPLNEQISTFLETGSEKPLLTEYKTADNIVNLICQKYDVYIVSLSVWCRSMLAANDFGLGEGGDFTHQLSYEAPKFKFTKNCHTKHYTATFAKPVLPAGVLSSVSCKSGL